MNDYIKLVRLQAALAILRSLPWWKKFLRTRQYRAAIAEIITAKDALNVATLGDCECWTEEEKAAALNVLADAETEIMYL